MMPDNVNPATHLENVIAGEVEAKTHLEKVIAGEVDPVTHLEKVIDKYGTGGGVDPESITLVTLNVSSNGTTNAPSGTAYNKVITAVPVPTLDTLNATANGTYTPTSGHAYSSVVVAIPAVTGVSF